MIWHTEYRVAVTVEGTTTYEEIGQGERLAYEHAARAKKMVPSATVTIETRNVVDGKAKGWKPYP